jgi:hypothetical protein
MTQGMRRRKCSAVACTPGTRGAGDVAQLVEHLVCNQGVVGSSPVASTILELSAARLLLPSAERADHP